MHSFTFSEPWSKVTTTHFLCRLPLILVERELALSNYGSIGLEANLRQEQIGNHKNERFQCHGAFIPISTKWRSCKNFQKREVLSKTLLHCNLYAMEIY